MLYELQFEEPKIDVSFSDGGVRTRIVYVEGSAVFELKREDDLGQIQEFLRAVPITWRDRRHERKLISLTRVQKKTGEPVGESSSS